MGNCVASPPRRFACSRVDPVPEIPENGPENDQFGELLYRKHVIVEDELDGYANIAAEFLPTYEIASATDPMFSFLRFLYMANEDHSTDSDESAQI
jgi:hypothetical protein